MTPPPTTTKRILVAIDSSPGSRATLPAAAALAARAKATLEALFVEDTNLLHLASLPFATELDPASGELRRFDSERMQRELRRQTEMVRRELNAASARRRIQCSLRVVRGQYLREAMGAAAAADIAFVSAASRVAVVGRHRDPPQPAAHPVGVLFSGPAASKRALLSARDLAHELGAPLVVLLPRPARGNGERLRRQVSVTIGDQPDVYLDTVAWDTTSIEAAIARLRCGVLFMARDESLLTSGDEHRPVPMRCTLALVA